MENIKFNQGFTCFLTMATCQELPTPPLLHPHLSDSLALVMSYTYHFGQCKVWNKLPKADLMGYFYAFQVISMTPVQG